MMTASPPPMNLHQDEYQLMRLAAAQNGINMQHMVPPQTWNAQNHLNNGGGVQLKDNNALL